MGAADRSVVMEKLWGITGGNEMRSFDDTRGDLKGVLGYTRHDELYSEVRPQEIQKRLDLFTTPQKSPHNQSVSPQIVSTIGKECTECCLTSLAIFCQTINIPICHPCLSFSLKRLMTSSSSSSSSYFPIC